MSQLATITSKRQLTIPAQIFEQAGLHKGQKVLIVRDEEGFRVKSAVQAVEKLAGLVRVPRRFKNLTIHEMIAQAKKEHFGQ